MKRMRKWLLTFPQLIFRTLLRQPSTAIPRELCLTVTLPTRSSPLTRCSRVAALPHPLLRMPSLQALHGHLLPLIFQAFPDLPRLFPNAHTHTHTCSLPVSRARARGSRRALAGDWLAGAGFSKPATCGIKRRGGRGSGPSWRRSDRGEVRGAQPG